MANNKEILELPAGVVAWPNLAEPYSYKDSPDKRYQVKMFWPASEYADTAEWKAIRKAIHVAAVAHFGPRVNPKAKGEKPSYATPFTRGEDTGKASAAGYVVANLKSKWPVTCADLTGDTPRNLSPADVKFGQRIRCSVIASPNNHGGTERVTLYLKFVGVTDAAVDTQFVEAQSAEGGGEGAAEHYASVSGGGAPAPASAPQASAPAQSGYDPLGDGDDIPF